MTRVTRLKSYLALEGNIIPLLVLVILIVTGEKLWERFLPKYLEEIGASVFILGGLGFLQNILGALWALQGGILSDKMGDRNAFRLYSLLAAGGYLIAILFTHWIAVFIGMIFFSAWSYLSLPGTMAMIVKTVGPRKAAMGISMHSIIRRLPMTIGPLLGAALITAFGMKTGMHWAFGISALLCIATLFFLKRFPAQKEPYIRIAPITLLKQMDPGLVRLLFSDILIRCCEQLPSVFVIIWCMNVVGISAGQFGILTAIEMLVATLIYIPVARYSDRMERKPFVVITFIFFSLFPLMLYFSQTWAMLIIAFIVRGLKEFGEPTRKALIVDLANNAVKARSVGLYYFIRDSIASLAALVGGVLWAISPSSTLWTAAVLGFTGTVLYAATGKSGE